MILVPPCRSVLDPILLLIPLRSKSSFEQVILFLRDREIDFLECNISPECAYQDESRCGFCSMGMGSAGPHLIRWRLSRQAFLNDFRVILPREMKRSI